MAETVSIKRIYDEVKKIERNMATKKDVDSLIDTIEVMSNPKTIRQIADSMEDIRKGRVKEVSSVKDLLNEM